MNNKNILALAVLAATTVTSVNVMAAAFQGDATVEVKNTFSISQIDPFDLGTIRATADVAADTAATMVISAETGEAGAPTEAAPSKIGQIIVGKPGKYEITDLGNFAQLEITAPVADVELKMNPYPPTTAYFKLNTFTYWITSGTNADSKYVAGTNKLTAGADGTASFTVGATISTTNKTTDGVLLPYQDAVYAGTFDVVVTY